MAGGRPSTSDLPGQPFVRLYTVEDAHRLRLADRELTDGTLVPWLVPHQTADRIAVLGKRGGVAIREPEDIEASLARLQESGQLGDDQGGSRRADAARYLGSRWLLRFTWEEKEGRFSVTLPAGARKMELLPSKGGSAVVFVAGSIFEIWRADDWLAYLRSLGFSPDHILGSEDLEDL